MAIYRPTELSTQLCYLFDSKKVTIPEFAAESGCSADYIVAVTNKPGTRIDWATKHAIGKALSHYYRLFPEVRPPSLYEMEQRRLQLVSEPVGDERKGTDRGVFEEPFPPAGCMTFISVDSRGNFVERREYVAAHVTRQIKRRIILGMEAYLDTVDPLSESITADT